MAGEESQEDTETSGNVTNDLPVIDIMPTEDPEVVQSDSSQASAAPLPESAESVERSEQATPPSQPETIQHEYPRRNRKPRKHFEPGKNFVSTHSHTVVVIIIIVTWCMHTVDLVLYLFLYHPLKEERMWYIVFVVVPVMLSHIRDVTSFFLVLLRGTRMSCQD